MVWPKGDVAACLALLLLVCSDVPIVSEIRDQVKPYAGNRPGCDGFRDRRLRDTLPGCERLPRTSILEERCVPYLAAYADPGGGQYRLSAPPVSLRCGEGAVSDRWGRLRP
jgi:hypothetical protein